MVDVITLTEWYFNAIYFYAPVILETSSDRKIARCEISVLQRGEGVSLAWESRAVGS